MSFMFHPFPYSDPQAINHINCNPDIKEDLCIGAIETAKKLKALLQGQKQIIAIDGYAGVEFSTIKQVFEQYIQATWVHTADLFLDEEAIEAIVAPYLPLDREIDPVLLYGKRYSDGYERLMDPKKIEAFRSMVQSSGNSIVLWGNGALIEPLRDVFTMKIWVDITPKQAALNFKYGKAINMGRKDALPFNQAMRRNYYIDFENALELRWDLIKSDALDYYISSDDPTSLQFISFPKLKELFYTLSKQPLRCRPVYLEGVWGGFHFTKLRNLPKTMRNCAWVFDMIPMEVSLVADLNGKQLEVPFFTFIQQQGPNLLGSEAFERFDGYFPMRFNYDDTYHASGNMSIQCHPDEAYVVKNHNELGRQDESYYVCLAGQQACTYLGFKKEQSCEEFFAAARKAEKTGEVIDYQQYVHAVPSKPGTQVMIPAGTIHASGRNQVVLEIGSLTVGSYTYKLYDYQRIDPQSGLPRPIHLNAGEKVIHPERTEQWVMENVVDHGYIVRQGENWLEKVVGEHDLLYFSLRNLVFEHEIEDDTKGTFHVLALVDGEHIRVESCSNRDCAYEAHNLDILVIPASMGKYRIINKGVGTVTVHKTLLKEQKA